MIFFKMCGIFQVDPKNHAYWKTLIAGLSIDCLPHFDAPYKISLKSLFVIILFTFRRLNLSEIAFTGLLNRAFSLKVGIIHGNFRVPTLAALTS